jgi:hypothetical protein
MVAVYIMTASLAVTVTVAVIHGDEPAARPAATADIEQLAWIAGTWHSKHGTDRVEEHWGPPLGDCMVGTLRWLRRDAVWMYELMTIAEEDGRPVFRLKHFNRDLAGWEPKSPAVAYPLARLEADMAVFENPEHDNPRRFIYERTGPTTLTVAFEGLEEGHIKRQEFRFERTGH